MLKPLNPILYRRLKDYFGQVRVQGEGVKQISEYRRNVVSGRYSLEIIEPGEYYAVSCPYCSDTRFRLYINHMWGKQDSEGNRNLWMAICYNENCLSHPGRYEDLLAKLLDPDGGNLAHASILEGKETDPANIIMDWPGPVTRVDHMPASHKAVQYLQSRSFDPKVIGKFYNVHYCHNSVHWLATDRLIIPIYNNKKMQGWQARYIGEVPKGPKAPVKYWTCPGTPRRSLIYNLGNARNYETGVIMEGPTDVWSLGPMGVCTLGSTMTGPQINMFVEAFEGRSGVLLYDPDVQRDATKLASAEKLASKLIEALHGKFAVVWLPDGRDPGNTDRRLLREYITAEAAKQNITVSWRRRT